MNWSWSQWIKSHHAQTSSGKVLPSHFWNRDNVRSILPGLRRKRTGLLLSGPESSFQMKVNFAFHLEIKVPESGGRVERHRMPVAWSPVWSFHSHWWFWVPCHLLVLPTVFSEVHSQHSHLPGHFRVLHASFCWKNFMEMLISFSSRTWHLPTLPKVPKAGSMTMVLLCLIGQQTTDLNPIYNLWVIVKRKMRHQTQQCRWPKTAIKASITPEQCHRLIASMPRCIDAVIQAKGGPTKYWVHKWTYFSEAWHFCLKKKKRSYIIF